MSSSNSSMTELMNDITRMILFCQIWPIGLIAFGMIGHVLSIFVFTSRRFRSSPCARYFLASTLSGILVAGFLVPLRMFQIGYNIDAFIYSTSICQFLSYLFSWFRILPSWFIVLASIDRSTSATLRKWSSIRVANYSIPLIILFCGLLYIHVPFNQAIFISPQRSCTYSTSTYRAFFSVWNLVVWGWIPTIFMLIFGFLTIRHVRQSRRRVATIQNDHQQNQNKVDRQLIQMLLLQCFIFTSTTTVAASCQLYLSIANDTPGKSDLERMRDKYIGYTGNWVGNFGPCMSFYLFNLSSQLFRRELINLLCCQRFVHKVDHLNAMSLQQTN